MGVQRVYPWVLLGPYVALVALLFPLERGRLRLSVPLNLAACVSFIAACHALNSHTRVTRANVIFIRTALPQSSEEKGSGGPLQESTANSPPGSNELAVAAPGVNSTTVPDQADAGLPNFLMRYAGFKSAPDLPALPNATLWSTLLDLLAYGAIVGLAHSVHFYRRFRERERRALFLESNLAHARLNALRAQLQPHFLFNSLNAIAALLRRDPRLAEATLLSLSELLRLALSHSEKQEILLREELSFVQHYLEIQRTRFGDKLQIEQVIEPESLDCLVPALLLQPLVENAIRHGLEPAEHCGIVRLSANRQDGKLVLAVEDNGVGLRATETAESSIESFGTALRPHEADPDGGSFAPRNGTGIGLKNLKARLQTLYGVRQKLELASRPQGGVRVRVEIPWHAASLPGAQNDANPP
jgi:two-component sensor histidine kinase